MAYNSRGPSSMLRGSNPIGGRWSGMGRPKSQDIVQRPRSVPQLNPPIPPEGSWRRGPRPHPIGRAHPIGDPPKQRRVRVRGRAPVPQQPRQGLPKRRDDGMNWVDNYKPIVPPKPRAKDQGSPWLQDHQVTPEQRANRNAFKEDMRNYDTDNAGTIYRGHAGRTDPTMMVGRGGATTGDWNTSVQGAMGQPTVAISPAMQAYNMKDLNDPAIPWPLQRSGNTIPQEYMNMARQELGPNASPFDLDTRARQLGYLELQRLSPDHFGRGAGMPPWWDTNLSNPSVLTNGQVGHLKFDPNVYANKVHGMDHRQRIGPGMNHAREDVQAINQAVSNLMAQNPELTYAEASDMAYNYLSAIK